MPGHHPQGPDALAWGKRHDGVRGNSHLRRRSRGRQVGDGLPALQGRRQAGAEGHEAPRSGDSPRRLRGLRVRALGDTRGRFRNAGPTSNHF